MLRSRFLWKLTAGYAACVLATALIVGALVAARITTNTDRAIQNRLAGEASLLAAISAPQLLAEPDAGFQHLVEELGRQVGARLTVVAADGRVVADSAERPSNMDNHGQRPEILDARLHGVGSARRFSRTLEERMLYEARSVLAEDGRVLGYARAALPIREYHGRLADLRSTITLGAGVATVVALLLGLFLARQFTRPIVELEAAAESIADGKYGRRLYPRSEDELGSLARSFNTMSQRLQETMGSLTAEGGKLGAILSSMVEGVVAVDKDQRVLHVNDVARRQLGMHSAVAEGRPVWELTRMREVTEALSEAIRNQAPVHRVTEAPDARERSLELHAAPLRRSDGVLDGAVVVIDDVTELHRLQTVRRDFVANVSHELKTPLTAIQGLLETLLDDPSADPETSRRFLEKARDQANRLSTLVNDLLSLSRLEATGVTADAEPIDARRPIESAIDSLQLVAEARRVRIDKSLPPEPVSIRGDSQALQDAVRNLVDNAIKYSPEGSTVDVRLRASPSSVVIEVEDHGVGIEPRHQERIFERFYRVDPARSRELGGTGLGLSIVRHVALGHDGAVSVDSKPGRGSTFRILLPPPREGSDRPAGRRTRS